MLTPSSPQDLFGIELKLNSEKLESVCSSAIEEEQFIDWFC